MRGKTVKLRPENQNNDVGKAQERLCSAEDDYLGLKIINDRNHITHRNLLTDKELHKSSSTCSDSSVLRRGEEVTLRDRDGGQSQYAHHYQVDEAGLRGAVEGVVQPGDERAHDQEGNPTVVQPEHTDTKS